MPPFYASVTTMIVKLLLSNNDEELYTVIPLPLASL